MKEEEPGVRNTTIGTVTSRANKLKHQVRKMTKAPLATCIDFAIQIAFSTAA